MIVVPLDWWILLSSALFSIGLFGALTRRSAIGILLSVELMLNAGMLVLLAFGGHTGDSAVPAAIFSLFVMAIAAADAVVALALFVAVFRSRRDLDVTRMVQLRG